MNIRICTPVIGSTLVLFLENLKKTEAVSDLIELRIDTIQDLALPDIKTIREHTTKPAIWTCRSKEEGGAFMGSEGSRVALIQKGIGLFEYVDIELKTVQAHDFTCNEKSKIIISYHNFAETPSYWDMQKIIFEMNQHKPDIIKIATMVHEEYELTKLYRLLTNKPHHEERIVVGMGEVGKQSRIIGPLLGSYLTYASTEWGESAPGQIEVKEMQSIYKLIPIARS